VIEHDDPAQIVDGCNLRGRSRHVRTGGEINSIAYVYRNHSLPPSQRWRAWLRMLQKFVDPRSVRVCERFQVHALRFALEALQ
jgi:hypothetical protein